MAFQKWELLRCDERLTSILAQECGISELAASILVARGHASPREAQDFLTPEDTLASPFDLIDMDKAVERIREAVDAFEPITIYGDYDCDGVTATAMLYTYLSSIGADVSWYLPERDGEGYGLNRKTIETLAANGTRLLITVDNGISAWEETALAKRLGMDVVITDHHQPGEMLPDAAAVVNPHRNDCPSEYKDLAGVGVAFKLIAALEDGDYQTALEYFADIVAVGTIGDVVPLTGENRILVKRGLEALATCDNIGLLALMKAAGLKPDKLDGRSIAFGLVPRINAAGRMGSAALAVRLLLSEEEEEAESLAEELDEKNRRRQTEEQTILADVEEMLAADRTRLDGRLLILKKEDWNHGILGIVCSKLLERYGKPVLLLCGRDGILRGSGRSIGNFHLFQALSANANCLIRFGGHKLAAGFSLAAEDFASFCQGMERYAARFFDLMPQNVITADREITPEQLTVEEIRALSVLEPFGAQNEQPLFWLKDAVLTGVMPLSGGKHQRLSLKAGGTSLSALWFGMETAGFHYRPGSRIDLLVNASLDTYNGNTGVLLKVKDIHPSGFAQDKFFAAKGYYEKLRRSEPVGRAIARRAIPDREETAQIYRFLRKNGGFAGDIDSLSLCFDPNTLNYCKLRLILDILEESGLIELSSTLDQILLCPVQGKADLEAAPTMRRMREQAI